MSQSVHRGLHGSAAFLKAALNSIPPGRVLLVCRPGSFRKSGAQHWLEDALGRDLPAFSEFSSNPKYGEMMNGVDLFRSLQAEALIAVGGGSVLDMAKLINFFGCRGISLEDPLEAPASAALPLRTLVAVPTTAGSGSEATHFAVVYRQGAKHSVAAPAIRPSHVILVPEFTGSASPFQTACSGMDALAQGIESHWARHATDESRRLAAQAVRLAWHNLEDAVHHPAPRNRARMQEAAHLAGRAINISKTTGAHAFSYILTSEFGLPHGHAVALLIPHFVDYHQKAGIPLEGIHAADLFSLVEQIHLARTLPMKAPALARLLLENVNLERLSNNPVPVTPEFIHSIAQDLAGKQNGA